MNEPAVFKVVKIIFFFFFIFYPGDCIISSRFTHMFYLFQVVTKTMPDSNIHRGDDELGGCQNHAYYHNVFCNQTFLIALLTINAFCNCCM